MSFSHLWRDYNIQRDRRYRQLPKLLKLSCAYVADHQQQLYALTETLERARHLKEFNFAMLGDQFEVEHKLSKEIRSFIIHCRHHHALIAKNAYMDLEHDLLDAEAHMHALQSLIVGHARRSSLL